MLPRGRPPTRASRPRVGLAVAVAEAVERLEILAEIPFRPRDECGIESAHHQVAAEDQALAIITELEADRIAGVTGRVQREDFTFIRRQRLAIGEVAVLMGEDRCIERFGEELGTGGVILPAPGYLQEVQRKAVRLEWISIAYLILQLGNVAGTMQWNLS